MIMDDRIHAPQIRFSGFSDDWEQRKLGETVENLKSGLSRMLSNEDIGIPVIRANNLVFGRVNFNDDIKYWYLQDPKGADTSNYLVHKGDILINFINSESKMGTASYVDAEPIRPTIYTTNILKLSVNNKYYSKFIFYITYTKRYINYVKSITKPAVNQASFTTVEYKKFSLSIPKYEEQKRIGQFFEKLDKLITLQQCKLDKLMNIKKSMLEKMFVEKNTDVPEIRFKGFADTWEQRKLGDLASIGSGRDYKHLSSGNIPVYGTGGYMLSVNEYLSDKDAIGIGRKGTIDKPYILNAPFWTVDTLFFVVPKNQVDLQYLFSVFQKIYWKKYDESTGVPSLSKQSIDNITIYSAFYEEQKRIGKFVGKLEYLITLHQRKLEKLKNIKTSCLEKMFV